MYLTYAKYLELGGKQEQAAFLRFGYKAEQMIDSATFKRLTKIDLEDNEEIKVAVELCMFELIEMQYRTDILNNNNNISSASNDGVSVSYNKIETSTEVRKIIDIFFSNVVINGVPALYVGVDNRGRL